MCQLCAKSFTLIHYQLKSKIQIRLSALTHLRRKVSIFLILMNFEGFHTYTGQARCIKPLQNVDISLVAYQHQWNTCLKLLLYVSKHLSNQLKIEQDIKMHLNPIITSLLSMAVKKLLISLIMQISIEKEVDQKASIHMISATYTHPYLIRN